MREISNFFDKFKSVALKELNKRENISRAILSITKQRIDLKDIIIKEGIVTISSNHGLKSELFLKKKLIIDLINKNGIKVVDIK